MVEGHGVHRVAHALRTRLVGRTLRATSPNARFTDGAAAIDGLPFSRIEAIGKNLFAFFGEAAAEGTVVVHVHFGMAGVWAVFDTAAGEAAPEPTTTTRLRLEADGLISHLSAMTVVHGGVELFEKKRAELGQDPLRDDADPERAWAAVSASRKSIGALLMDQSVFAGPGNIYRAEILFVAKLHPDTPGAQLSREQFELVWATSVRLLTDGFTHGSIITVSRAEAAAAGKADLRRWIYNRATCGYCNGRVLSWEIAARTCYACPACQPRSGTAPPPKGARETKVFNSHCARDKASVRLAQGGCAALTVPELREQLRAGGLDVRGVKAVLVARLEAAMAAGGGPIATAVADVKSLGGGVAEDEGGAPFTSAVDAAVEKLKAGESRAVEHIAELAPEQARRIASELGMAGPTRKRSAAAADGAANGATLPSTLPQRKPRRAAAVPAK
jgi:formamidopyrimidine-DNA glycosylase